GTGALGQFALAGLAPLENVVAAAVGERSLLEVEAQVGLALAGVGAVTGEAVIGEDGPDVAVELELPRLPDGGGTEEGSGHYSEAETEQAPRSHRRSLRTGGRAGR